MVETGMERLEKLLEVDRVLLARLLEVLLGVLLA